MKMAAGDKFEQDSSIFRCEDPVLFLNGIGNTDNNFLLSTLVDVEDVKNRVQSKMPSGPELFHQIVSSGLQRPVNEYTDEELGAAVAKFMARLYAQSLKQEYEEVLPKMLHKLVPMKSQEQNAEENEGENQKRDGQI